MPGWKTAPVDGVWRLENADYHGHRLTVYRSRSGAYRAYLNGRLLGLWKSKEAAIEAAEKAALARMIEDRLSGTAEEGVSMSRTDVTKTRDDLAEVERNIRETTARIDVQRKLIKELRADGHVGATKTAVELLNTLEQSLHLLMETKNLIVAELNEMGGWASHAENRH